MAHTAQSPDQRRDAPRTGTRVRQAGHRLIVVSTIGTDAYSSWGFTVWEEGICLAGQCNWNWGLCRSGEPRRWLDRATPRRDSNLTAPHRPSARRPVITTTRSNDHDEVQRQLPIRRPHHRSRRLRHRQGSARRPHEQSNRRTLPIPRRRPGRHQHRRKAVRIRPRNGGAVSIDTLELEERHPEETVA